MKSYSKIFTAIIIFSVLLVPFVPFFQSSGESSDTGVSLEVISVPICDNDGICETGETNANCPLDCQPPPPDTTPPVIYDISVDKITANSAEISWKTNENALCQLFLGKTQEYEAEVITESTFYSEHLISLINLSPQTTHHFKIACKDYNQNKGEIGDQEFTTLSLPVPPDTTPPANVLNFQATPGDTQITLTWENPPDPDFKAVKIMRSDKFYPATPDEGIPIYDDDGDYFLDTGLINETRYYYTAFAYDEAGNYSSGAIASAVPQKPGAPPPPEEIPPEVPPPPEVEEIDFNDFEFTQENKKVSLVEDKLNLKANIPLTASIAYEKVPEVLKTIMITLEKDSKIFSFLLRINKEKTRYEAIIYPPEPGIYPLTLAILNYKNQTLKTIKGLLIIEGPTIIVGPAKTPWYKNCKIWLLILLILLILAAIIYFIRKKIREKKEKEKKIEEKIM